MNYIEYYGDFEATAALCRRVQGDCPPIHFTWNGEDSDALPWQVTLGKTVSYVDFPTDSPSHRVENTRIYTAGTLCVTVVYTSYEGWPVVEYEAVLKNRGEENTPIIADVEAIHHEFTLVNPQVRYNKGSLYTNQDFQPFCQALPAGETLELTEVSGRYTQMWLQFFNLCGEEHGVIAALSWQGNWKMSFTGVESGLRMTGGAHETRFVLCPGEFYRAPRIVLLPYRGEWIYGQNIWRRWIYACNLLRVQGVRMGKNLLTCIGGFFPGMLGNAAADLAEIERLKNLEVLHYIDHFTQDAGWYKAAPYENWYGTGNWYPDPDRYPAGMKPVADAIHEAGMKYCVWFEPERLYSGMDSAKDLKGKLIPPNADQYEHLPDGTLCLVDYADPAAVDYFIEKLDALITDNGIDMYRQDFNINPAIYWENRDRHMEKLLGIPRRGLTEEAYGRGYLRLWDSLIARHPGMIIDSCSGGGTRNDLETVRRSFPHTRSDKWDCPFGAQNQTYGMCMWYILQGGGGMDWFNDYERRSQIITSMGTVFHEVKPGLLARIEEWEMLAEAMLHDFYPLTPYIPEDEGTVGMQFHDEKAHRGIVAVYVRAVADGDPVTVRPRELDADRQYNLTCNALPGENAPVRTVSGRELMDQGLTVETRQTNMAYIYRYDAPSAK